MSIATDGHALMQAILAELEEDLVRFVFADWLEENGQSERGEFIRVQCELARTPTELYLDPDDSEDREIQYRLNYLRERERAILDSFSGVRDGSHSWSNRALWAKAIEFAIPHHPWEHVEFKRGFIHTVRLPHDAFLQHGQAICRAHPIERVELSDREPDSLNSESDDADDSGWFHWSVDSPLGSGSLDYRIWDLLPGDTIDDDDDLPPRKSFWGLKYALDALSTACLKYGRQP